MTPGPVPLFFVAHPLGNGPTRGINIIRAKLWTRILVEIVEGVAFQAPWIIYAETLSEAEWRDRGLRDNLSAISRFQGLVAVGHMSPGVCVEWEYACEQGKRVVNITDLPADPVEVSTGPHHRAFRDTIASRFRRALA